ncbi:MAG TPA: Spy/CpxP family protein refolding chaperone [Gemmatimonadaceae bacterium]
MMMMMRKRFLGVAVLSLAALAACSSDPAAPDELALLDGDVIDLVPDYAVSSAAVIDGGGIGGARLPEDLQLTAEQKAEIVALHDAFMADNADEVQALRDLERQLRELRQNGGTREDRRALLEQAKTILDALADEFAALQDAIWAVYTPEQRAWIEEHRPKICRPGERPQLTDEQIAQIRALQQAFQAEMADEIAAIKAAHEAARAAHQAGATREEIHEILSEVQDELAALRAAEKQLMDDIQEILTPEQREGWCVVRRHVAPGHP